MLAVNRAGVGVPCVFPCINSLVFALGPRVAAYRYTSNTRLYTSDSKTLYKFVRELAKASLYKNSDKEANEQR